ncbi:metallochaperone AztD [Pseudotabrizicola formosa]|uniref:metallochaperone AztD n=1 Tax=Pseudotabrizicola formosa TaxID=2030009 RepID=UPI000CD0CF75|nr:metallochaperone AztD [Pseudotabrizicola formosa]
MTRIASVSSRLLASAALTVLSAAGALAEDAETHYRLFIGDHAEGVVRAIDAESGEALAAFDIDMTPALTASASGRFVFAVQGDAAKVAVIDTGIALEDHGDHADITLADPALLEITLTGTKPAHVVEGSGRIALFDDGTGDVTVFSELGLLQGRHAPETLSPGAAHHGLAAPMGDYMVVSVPHDDPEQPRVGLKVIDKAGAQIGEVMPCPAVHGQAQSARVFAFGCKDGVVFASPGQAGAAPDLIHVPTAELGEGNVSTLKGGTALQVFLGNYGPDAVVLIEPGSDAPFRKIDLPTRRVDFALDPVIARNVYILTEDGQLHLLDILSGEIKQSVTVTDPYSMDGHWRDPRPRLAVAGDHIAITDPLQGMVRMISTETLTEVRQIPVEGVPYTIIAVGGSGATH